MRVSILGAALIAAAPAVAWACCPAPPAHVPVQIADQDIVVTWNAKTKEEHFVRRAKFRGAESKDFGFLVPTPTKPELAEAPDEVFERLQDLLRPEVVTKQRLDFTPLVFLPLVKRMSATYSASADALPFVNVLEEKRVAGFDAAVLEASDAAALTGWLAAHGYAARPEITDWAEPYVKAQWKITAFKLPAGAARVDTSAVRMSFTADEPLFPYRVPTDNRNPNGLLRVYFVGSERVVGQLGAKAAAWQAATRYSKDDARVSRALAGAIPSDRMPGGLWLTAFEDHAWPGSGDDLYFRRATDQSTVVPPPIVHEETIPVPLDVVLGLAGVVFFVRRKLRGFTPPRDPAPRS